MKIIASVIFALVASLSIGAENPAAELSRLIQAADRVTIEFYSSSKKKEVVTFRDDIWLARLSMALALSSFKSQPRCLCISYPKIALFRGKEQIGIISVHHSEKLRVFGEGISGDFLVGAKTGEAIRSLANERKEANQLREPTPPAVTSPAAQQLRQL